MSPRGSLLAATALLFAPPASAQPVPTPSDEDLRCAAWAALVGGSNQDDPEVATAFGMALTWFAGRYEAATGTPFEQAMTADYLNGLAPQLAEIERACLPRMQEMGQRFSAWGAKLQETGQERDEP